jgi:hypothetical protein
MTRRSGLNGTFRPSSFLNVPFSTKDRGRV